MPEPVGASLTLRSDVNVTGPFLRTSHDAIRSMLKYVSGVLGEAWEVRIADDEGTFRTPFARVFWTGPAVYEGTRHYPEVTRPVAVHCYPDYPEGGTIEQSYMLCEQVEEAIFRGFMVGVGVGHPERIPLYNYEGIPLDGPTSEARGAHDYMRLVRGSLSIDRVPDPTDDRWITVVASMRLTWRRPGQQIVGKPVQSVTSEFAV